MILRFVPRCRRMWHAAIVALLCGPGLLFAQTLSLTFDDGFDLQSTPDAAEAVKKGQRYRAFASCSGATQHLPVGRLRLDAGGKALADTAQRECDQAGNER